MFAFTPTAARPQLDHLTAHPLIFDQRLHGGDLAIGRLDYGLQLAHRSLAGTQ